MSSPDKPKKPPLDPIRRRTRLAEKQGYLCLEEEYSRAQISPELVARQEMIRGGQKPADCLEPYPQVVYGGTDPDRDPETDTDPDTDTDTDTPTDTRRRGPSHRQATEHSRQSTSTNRPRTRDHRTQKPTAVYSEPGTEDEQDRLPARRNRDAFPTGSSQQHGRSSRSRDYMPPAPAPPAEDPGEFGWYGQRVESPVSYEGGTRDTEYPEVNTRRDSGYGTRPRPNARQGSIGRQKRISGDKNADDNRIYSGTIRPTVPDPASTQPNSPPHARRQHIRRGSVSYTMPSNLIQGHITPSETTIPVDPRCGTKVNLGTARDRPPRGPPPASFYNGPISSLPPPYPYPPGGPTAGTFNMSSMAGALPPSSSMTMPYPGNYPPPSMGGPPGPGMPPYGGTYVSGPAGPFPGPMSGPGSTFGGPAGWGPPPGPPSGYPTSYGPHGPGFYPPPPH